MKRQKTSAFTLIELLVVIAIIAILAAILFPVFAQARESARIATCLSNMNQLGLGMIMYAQDYDEYFPGSRIYDPDQPCEGQDCGQVYGFRTAVYPYIKNYAVFQCPSNPYRNSVTEEADKNFKVSYAENGDWFNFGLDKSGRSHQPGPNDSQIDRPADTVMILESLWQDNDLGDWVGRINNPPACGWGAGFFQHRGNNNTSPIGGLGNWAFFDGHVKALKFPAVFQPQGTAPNRYNLFGFEDGNNLQGRDGTTNLNLDEGNNMCPRYQ